MSMHPPPDPDELASDLVDGLLSADEAARLRNDPAIAARVEAIEAARAALRVPPPSAPGAVDRALAATFAALDRGAPPGDPAVAPEERPPPPVTHLRSVGAPTAAGGPWAPTHRAKRGSSGMPWLAAAAAIVLLGLVTIGILSNGSDSDGDQATTAAADSSEAEADDGGGGEGAVQSGDDETTAVEDGAGEATASSGDEPEASPPTTAEPLDDRSGTGGVRQLGAVGSAAELADRIRSQDGLSEPATPEQEASPGDGVNDEISACPSRTVAGDTSRGQSLYVADAMLDGARVRVHVYDPGDGNLRLVATDESCVDVVDAPYSGSG